MDLKRVVITGLGTINPLGHNVPEFWDNLLKGVSGAGPITRFDASKFRTQFACAFLYLYIPYRGAGTE